MTKNNTPQLENKLITIGVALLLLFIYACSGISSVFGVFGDLSYNNLGTLTIPSVFLFLLVCFIGLINERFYFALLIFVVVAFPALCEVLEDERLPGTGGSRENYIDPSTEFADSILLQGLVPLLMLLGSPLMSSQLRCGCFLAPVHPLFHTFLLHPQFLPWYTNR